MRRVDTKTPGQDAVENLWWEDADLVVKTTDGRTTRYVDAWFTGTSSIVDNNTCVTVSGATFAYSKKLVLP